ncbi:MAG: phosphotransferase, partial [Alphaproteobacteria bacterium]|nr:phosphotransferase [Alphaproteobacteria bacterium]
MKTKVKQGNGLVPVHDTHHFAEDVLQSYLGKVLPDFAGSMSVLQFRGGQSNPTFHISTAEREYVLRKKPPGKLLPSAHAVDREYQVLNALLDSGVPVPRVLHFCD